MAGRELSLGRADSSLRRSAAQEAARASRGISARRPPKRKRFRIGPAHFNIATVNGRKSTVVEIRERFDTEVERFSNLEAGHSATIDAPLALELIARAASLTTPNARQLMDVGCGAGNYTLKLLQYLPGLNATLVELS